MALATCRNLSFNSVKVGDSALSSLIISSVALDFTSDSRAVVSNPLWGAPRKIIERTGSLELYIPTEPLISHST